MTMVFVVWPSSGLLVTNVLPHNRSKITNSTIGWIPMSHTMRIGFVNFFHYDSSYKILQKKIDSNSKGATIILRLKFFKRN